MMHIQQDSAHHGVRRTDRYQPLAIVLISIILAVSITSHTAAQQALTIPLPSDECGISIEPVYYGEVFTNARGGITTNDATQYQALFGLAMTLDLDRVGLPGEFFLLAQNTHGRGLTQDFIGDAQVLSNIDSGDNIMRVNEYWWQFSLLDDNVTVRLGKQDLNTEFLFMESAEDFIQSSFGLTPALSLPTYPDPSMGAVVLAQLTDSWQLKVGFWDALAFGGSWGISGNSTVFGIVELERKYALADGTLPGTLALGVGYLSGGEISGMPIDASHGYLVQIEQMVWRECLCESEPPQGLGIFFSYVPRFSSGQIIDESLGDSFAGGLVYRGLLPQRDEDVVGAGVAWAELFQGGTDQETVFELFYKARITRHISVQPDLQYIATPSGIHRDAFVLGVRCQIDFAR